MATLLRSSAALLFRSSRWARLKSDFDLAGLPLPSDFEPPAPGRAEGATGSTEDEEEWPDFVSGRAEGATEAEEVPSDGDP
jgi:hypothetical protein